MEKYFSTHQVAKMCQVTRGSVIRWIHEGKLSAAVTAGGHHRIQPQNLYDLLKSLKMEVPADLANLIQKDTRSRILIVDDDLNIRKMLVSFFQKRLPDFVIHEAGDGFEAGLLVSDLKPNLILLDLMLPGIDGFKVCEKIRSQRDLDGIKIIAITGLQEDKARESILRLGADDFLSKPFNLTVLEEKIRHHLGQSLQNSNHAQGGMIQS